MNKPILITMQQEAAFAEYLYDESVLEFWDYYWHWCYENGVYSDKQSHQYTEESNEV
jgi:hypothetical protein